MVNSDREVQSARRVDDEALECETRQPREELEEAVQSEGGEQAAHLSQEHLHAHLLESRHVLRQLEQQYGAYRRRARRAVHIMCTLNT